MVARGLVSSRQQAADLIDGGGVLVSGTVAVKASRLVAPSEPVHLTGPRARYVSRGGEKLAAALEHFGLDVAGARALDAGSSTGGFTDCLLQHGAVSVTSLDVGRGQLHERLRSDERVDVREQIDVRGYTLEDAGGTPYDVVTADLSFISLTRALPVLAGELGRPGADLVVLVKPQFEAGRSEASKGKGVIRDAAVHRRTLGEVCDALAAEGAHVTGAMPSPITGHAGNVEFLVHARAHADTGPAAGGGTGAVIDAAVTGRMLDAAVTDAHDRADSAALDEVSHTTERDES
jgi:23S rRNA (cytidine1920-2'-O)/16S rRNA (cytidine1409-2'-O)-methyltransferase